MVPVQGVLELFGCEQVGENGIDDSVALTALEELGLGAPTADAVG